MAGETLLSGETLQEDEDRRALLWQDEQIKIAIWQAQNAARLRGSVSEYLALIRRINPPLRRPSNGE